jgi:hypothetical protein
MNESCKSEQHNSGDSQQECNLETTEARETIKHALETQIELSQARNEMKNMDVIRGWSSVPEQQLQAASTVGDHSFTHFVDYHAIGEYESH